MNEYPKWVKRDEHIGPVLCRNEKEERELLNAWDTEQAEKAEAEAEAAKKLVAEAEAAKKLVAEAEAAAKVELKKAGK